MISSAQQVTYECRGGPEEAYQKEEVGEEEGGWIIEREGKRQPASQCLSQI